MALIDFIEKFWKQFTSGLDFSKSVKVLKETPGPKQINGSADSISKNGYDLIKKYEALRLKAYYPTPDDVPTIGWGHTKGVKMGDVITQAQAEKFLREDATWVENAIDRYVTVSLNQNQYDALASWVFNLGPRNLLRSTMLKRINEKHFDLVPYEMKRWNKQGTKTLNGLIRRRADEAALWSKPMN